MLGRWTVDQKDAQYLGFMSLKENAKGGYIGAVLVTDMSGVPQEFRCTHPVRATAVQRILYGATLVPYIGIELCAKPLFSSLQKKPTLLLLAQSSLLDLRMDVSCPVLVVGKEGDAFEVKAVGTSERSAVRVERTRFPALVIQAHPAYPTDQTVGTRILESAAFDLPEAFERVTKAIQTLAEQDTRFQ